MEARILLATPAYADVTAETTTVIAKLAQHPQIVDYFTAKSNYIHFGRNLIVMNFMQAIDKMGLTHLMMIDGDIIPPPNIVELLLACDAPLASAPVPILLNNERIVSNVKARGEIEWMSKLDTSAGIFDADKVGTGCVLIHKEVFQSIPFPWFDTDCSDETTSDCWFCDKAAHHGYKFKVNPAALCDHIKRVSLLKVIRGINQRSQVIERKAS